MPSTRRLGVPRSEPRYPALRAVVEIEMARRNWQIRDLVRRSGLAENTVRNIGLTEPSSRTIAALRVLGLSAERIAALRAAEWITGESDYDETTMTIAALCAGMPTWQREVVLDLARSMISRSPDQSD